MRIGKKIFPYPTINNAKEYSTYSENSSFELKFELNDENQLIFTNDYIILKNIHFKLKNDSILDYFKQGIIKCNLIIECSASLFRETYELTTSPKDIKIPIQSLKDMVYISAYIYANQDIVNFQNEDFIDDYKNYRFRIEKYDILAIDDGFTFSIQNDTEKDNKVNSIFTISMHDKDNDTLYYEMTTDEIDINLSPKYFKIYNSIKSISQTNNIMFGLILIPVLSRCLDDIKKSCLNYEYDDISQIIDNWHWFKAICNNYKQTTNKTLDIDEFINMDTLLFSQSLLNNATCKAINDINNFLTGDPENGGLEDE
jgi:hypothetical protein